MQCGNVVIIFVYMCNSRIVVGMIKIYDIKLSNLDTHPGYQRLDIN